MIYVYYLLSQAGDLLYIGRALNPADRRARFERTHKMQTVPGIPQRHSSMEAAAAAELAAIAKHRPPFNKYLTSSPGRFGKSCPHSDETKQKISRAKMGVANPKLQGRVFSDETKAKMRAAKVGRKLSPETRARMSAAHLGVPKMVSEAKGTRPFDRKAQRRGSPALVACDRRSWRDLAPFPGLSTTLKEQP